MRLSKLEEGYFNQEIEEHVKNCSKLKKNKMLDFEEIFDATLSTSGSESFQENLKRVKH